MIDNDHPWTTPQDYIDEARKRNRRGFFVGIDELEMFQGHIAEAEARAERFRRHAELAEHVADMMAIGTEAEYNEADRKLEASRSQLYEHGDLTDAAGKGSEA